jgi:hypothetical protein
LGQFVFREKDMSAQAAQRPHHIGDYEDSILMTVPRFHGPAPAFERSGLFGWSKIGHVDVSSERMNERRKLYWSFWMDSTRCLEANPSEPRIEARQCGL